MLICALIILTYLLKLTHIGQVPIQNVHLCILMFAKIKTSLNIKIRLRCKFFLMKSKNWLKKLLPKETSVKII